MAVQAHDGADGCADDIDVLAIVVVGGYLGIACYSQSCCRMEVCECVLPKCGEGDASLDQSSTASRAWHMSLAWLWRFVEVHTPLVLLPDQGSDLLCQSIVQLPGSNVYRLSTTSGFNPKEAFARLKGMYPNLSTEEFGTRFHWRHRAMLSAMSALLHFCATCRINVADVIERSPPHLMYLTEEDARWLQVTRNDPHPCGYQGVGRSKEGLSLVSIIDRCQTSLGKKLLRQWLSLPSNDIEEIESRQEFIEWFVNPDRRELLHNLRKELHCVKPPRQVLTLLRCGKMSLRHYQCLFLCVNSLLTILELVTPCAHEVLFLRELVECLDVHSLVTMRDMMGSFVVQVTDKSSDRSAAAKKEHSCDGSSEVSIRPDVDSTGRLRDLHILLEHLGGSLAQKTEEAFNQLSCSLQRVLTLRCSHIVPHGYLLYVSTAPMDRLDLRNVEEQLAGHNEDDPLLTFLTDWGDGENCEEGALTNGTDSRVAISRRGSNVAFLSECYGWTFHHATGTHLFFKTPTMTELDSQVGDVMEHLHARERELRCCLDETLAQNACALTLASQTLAKLDSLLSLASCAVDFNWTRPSLRSDAGTLCIADGWHPILGTVVGPTAIQPFSIEMRRPQDRICIITGAHCSGKSVLLAAVAHIVILAHVGSFVPARRVEMGLIRSVLTIATMYGLEMGTSTSSFTADCSTLDRHVRYVDLLRTAVRPKNSAAADGEGGALAHVDGSRLFEGGEVDLLLLDEFGRGTSPEDGKALLGATLRYAAGMAPYDPQGEDSAAHSCIRRSTRPIVLCATHFVEMLDAQQDCDFRLDSGASFPFEEVQIYHMRCETAVAENPEEQDLVPTYTPYRVTQRDGHHELDYFQYRSALVDGGIFLGTTCGLERRMLENWKNAVAILKEGDAALKNINCGV